MVAAFEGVLRRLSDLGLKPRRRRDHTFPGRRRLDIFGSSNFRCRSLVEIKQSRLSWIALSNALSPQPFLLIQHVCSDGLANQDLHHPRLSELSGSDAVA
jgi:hypothetical protein